MIDIYAISLSRAKNRRAHLNEHLPTLSSKFTIIEAIDYKNLTLEEIINKIDKERRSWTNYLRPGAVCCSLSHMKAYIEFLNTNCEHCLIIEDDAKLAAKKN